MNQQNDRLKVRDAGAPERLRGEILRLAALAAFTLACPLFAQSASAPETTNAQSIDQDLMEVTVPKLERFYSEHRYTVTEVANWYIARIRKYNPVYGAIEDLEAKEALAAAAKLDAEAAAGGKEVQRGPLWGVPIVIKDNTSVTGPHHQRWLEGLQDSRL